RVTPSALAGEAPSERGKDRSLALVPSAEPDEVDRLQSLTGEAIELFERSAEPDVADVPDVGHTAEGGARRGGRPRRAESRRGRRTGERARHARVALGRDVDRRGDGGAGRDRDGR